MAATDKQKQSLYFPEETLREIMSEAVRLDRSLSWTVQQAWRLARNELKRFPSVNACGEIARGPAPAHAPRERSAPLPATMERREPSEQVREFLKGKFDRELAG
ncbi:conserved hypothetical protein [Anaeromyxobacter dehalogenans 2CP-1]|uniref:TIGR04563 family protein n=1 Tax=Anaeromyxobacter dehalogenans (strain ATCC BAA-258 / DSM 21875 / 2CP-1) TaxID=455488 RepID=B8JG61_ANAD2|nr:TIGR04563 family protein [Anaeromyxobacter dehalogenans]ACL66464.1 conserved hypothetical protein [Anaeromyxobacter dehalogenans 2CP-1]